MTNTQTGRLAEGSAAKYLVKQGYHIIDQNWKTKLCEVDIIASKNKTIIFIEVKYRANNSQGSGLDYITSNKLKRMQFAAESWVALYNWNKDYALGAIELSGPNFEVTQFLPVLE